MINYFKKRVEDAGGVYVGIQNAINKRYVVYNDPITHTTIMVDVKYATINNLRKTMLIRRRLFIKKDS